jgi:hypothetical protein
VDPDPNPYWDSGSGPGARKGKNFNGKMSFLVNLKKKFTTKKVAV